MYTPKDEVNTYKNIICIVLKYFNSYGLFLAFIYIAVSDFNSGVMFAYFVDFVTHKFQRWYFNNEFFSPNYSTFHWVKKFLIIPLYHVGIGKNSDLPAWVLTLIQIITLTVYHPDYKIGQAKVIAYFMLVLESSFSMYFFCGYSFKLCLNSSTLTLFILFYILVILDSVSKLTNKVEEQYMRYKNLVDYIHGIFVILDGNLNIKFANNSILNIKQEEMVGKNLKDFPFYNEKKIEKLKMSKTRQRYNWKVLNQKNELLWYVVDATIQYSKTKKRDEIALLIQDVSFEKKVEEKEKLNIQNIASLKAKNEFIASISHEIRNPLQVISYNSENLLSKNLTTEIKEILVDIYNSTQFLTSVIGDILDHSKIEAGEMKIIKQKFNIQEVVENSIKMNSKSCLHKSLKMNLNYDFTLPKYFFGDSSRILQIMNNFISNAIKYTEEGSINVSITKKHQDEDDFDHLYFECKDSGIGISKKKINTLFDPFIQISQKKLSPTEFKGWGLGLSICRNLLRLMNGEFGVESDVGKGSKFWFTIPFENTIENSTMAEYLKNMKLNVHHVSVIHSDLNLVNQIVNVLKHTNIRKIEVNSIYFEKNQIVMGESSAIKNIPIQKLNIKFVDITTKKKSQFPILKYPILPSNILKLISKSDKKVSNLGHVKLKKNLKILMVDDNALIVKSLQKLLETLEIYNVTIAKNGKEAIDIVKDLDSVFDVIFMDIAMPIMNGIEATKIVRNLKDEEKKNVFIVALTGNVLSKSIEEQCEEWKMDQILIKPVNKNEVVEVLQKITKMN